MTKMKCGADRKNHTSLVKVVQTFPVKKLKNFNYACPPQFL